MAAAIFGWFLLLLGMVGTLLAPRPQQGTAPTTLRRDAGLLLVSWGAILEAAALLLAGPGSLVHELLTTAALGALGAGAALQWWPHTKP